MALRVLESARQAMTAIRDSTLPDRAKEKAARQAAMPLFSDFISMAMRSLIAMLASATVIFAADRLRLVPAPVAIDRLEAGSSLSPLRSP
jgi:hypothetical protein